jgi:hypothetical protein
MDRNSKDFNQLDFEYNFISGQVASLLHILNYVEEIDILFTNGIK